MKQSPGDMGIELPMIYISVYVLSKITTIRRFSTTRVSARVKGTQYVMGTSRGSRITKSYINEKCQNKGIMGSLHPGPSYVTSTTLHRRPKCRAKTVGEDVQVTTTPSVKVSSMLLHLNGRHHGNFVFRYKEQSVMNN